MSRPTFQARHYNVIAAQIRAQYESAIKRENGIAAAHAVYELAHSMALEFVADNPRFDMSRFLEACGIGEQAQRAA